MKKMITGVCVSMCFIMVIAGAAYADQSSFARTPLEHQERFLRLTEAEKASITAQMTTTQIPFIANTGQADEQVMFYANTFGGTVFITRDGEIVYSLPKAEEDNRAVGVALHEEFVGGTVEGISGEEKTVTRVNYFKGKDQSTWRSNIPTYELVNLGEVYQGIDVKLKAYGNNVEKLFVVQPGAQPEQIRVRLNGAYNLRVNHEGELEAETDLGVVRFTKPAAYQETAGQKKYVEVAYAVNGVEYGFMLGEYDREEALIIDPLLASTFLGGSGADYADYIHSVTVDQSGNVYVVGGTISSDFPTIPGAYDESFNGFISDVFVARLDSELSTLLASTFLGGSDTDYNGDYNGTESDYGNNITLDDSGNVYIAGQTGSSDFPTTPGAYDDSHNSYVNGFIARLDSNLSTDPCETADLVFEDWLFNVNGDTYHPGDTLPDSFDDNAFDWDTGRGAISVRFEPGMAGDYSISASFDYLFSCITPECYTFSTETVGTLADGQILDIEIDEYDLTANLGWEFSLANDSDWAELTFILGETLSEEPYSLFSYTNICDDGQFAIASTIDIVPEPSTLLLLGCGLVGVLALGRKHLKR